MNTTKNKEEYAMTVLIALFKSIGETVRITVHPDYSEEGEFLDFGKVQVEGDLQPLFFFYGNIEEKIAEFTQLIQEAEAMLPDFEDLSKEEKVSSINEIFAWFEGGQEDEE